MFWKGVKEFFGFSGVAESALKIVDKIAGTDWTPEQKAEHVLKFMAATKHQSPARRLIATGIILEQFILSISWLICTMTDATVKADAIAAFLSGNISTSLNIIIGFYFLSTMIKR